MLYNLITSASEQPTQSSAVFFRLGSVLGNDDVDDVAPVLDVTASRPGLEASPSVPLGDARLPSRPEGRRLPISRVTQPD